MFIRSSTLAPSRREFLKGICPAGALLWSGCGFLSASNRLQDDSAQHKFAGDSNLTMREAFRFAFQWVYIPMMEALAARIGREKLVAMLKEATGIYWAQQTRNYALRLQKKNFDAFLNMDTLDPAIDDPNHRRHFWSLAYSAQRIEHTSNTYELKVTECLWAQTFREANAGDIGFVSICYGDEAMAAAFDRRLKLIRTKTLMQGDDSCPCRWVWEE